MTTAATADATSYTGTISTHMGRSSKRTGPTLIRLRGTPVGLQSASLMTLRPVDRSKFSKSTASRLRRYYRADGPCRLLQQSGESTKLSSREALLGIFKTMCRRIFGKTRVNRGPVRNCLRCSLPQSASRLQTRQQPSGGRWMHAAATTRREIVRHYCEACEAAVLTCLISSFDNDHDRSDIINTGALRRRGSR